MATKKVAKKAPKRAAKKVAVVANGVGSRPRSLAPTIQNVHGDKFYTTDRTFDAVEAVNDNAPDSKEFALGLRRLEGRLFDADYKAAVQYRRAALGHHVLSKCDSDDVSAYGALVVSAFA